VTLFSAGRQRVIDAETEDLAYFCRKTPAVFGGEVYRKSTGVSVPGKSSGNERTLTSERAGNSDT